MYALIHAHLYAISYMTFQKFAFDVGASDWKQQLKMGVPEYDFSDLVKLGYLIVSRLWSPRIAEDAFFSLNL